MSSTNQTSERPRIRHDAQRDYTFGYLDESGSSSRWFGCGLLVHGPSTSGLEDERLNEHIRKLKVVAGMSLRGDFGWKKVPTKPGKYLDFYQRCIEGFFRHPQLRFCALVVDTRAYPLDSKQFFRGCRDVGMDAFAYHLIRGTVLKNWSGDRRLYVRFDRRSRPDDVHLGDTSRRLTLAMPPGSQVNLRSITGGKHPLVQIADLLLGAVLGAVNQNVTSPGRLALLKMIAAALECTPADLPRLHHKKLNVWTFSAPPQPKDAIG